jgi:toxin ParE1/3/4
VKRAIWASQALDDFIGIDHFYAESSPDYADRVGNAAVRAVRFLTDNPFAGPRVEGDTRKWRVPGTDYLLLYDVVPDGIEILRVHHGREDWLNLEP